MSNNNRSGGRRNERSSNNRSRNRNERGPRGRNNFKKNFKNREKEKENARVPIRFEHGKLDDKKVKHKFTVYGEEDETTIMTQVYSGTSEEELLIAIKDIWETVDEYDLLPLEEDNNGEEMGPGRTRRATAVIIGVDELPEPRGAGAVAERARRIARRLTNRKVAFRMTKNILKKEEASKLFKKALEDERVIWEEEEADRADEAQEEAVRIAREADPNIDPADVPLAAVVARVFFCQRTLERCLNKVVAGILPTDAVMHQIKYMKATKKPRQLTAKAWMHRLSEMREYLYWMSENNHTMDELTFNQDVIKENIPLEWVVDFEKSSTARAINRSTAKNQPALREVLDELEQIEASEQVKRRVENLKEKHGDRRNYGDKKKNMCRIPGHNHE